MSLVGIQPNDLLSRNAVRDERLCGSQAFVGSSMLLLCRGVILSTHHNRGITVKPTVFRLTRNNTRLPPFCHPKAGRQAAGALEIVCYYKQPAPGGAIPGLMDGCAYNDLG